MRATAKINEFALAIERNFFVPGDSFDNFGFVMFTLALKERDGLGPVPNFACDFLVAVDDFMHASFYFFQILGDEWLIAGEVVKKTILDVGTDGDLGFRK